MAKIGEIAKISRGNQELKDDIPSAARLIWEAFHEKAENEPEKYNVQSPYWINGRAGFSIQYSMSQIIFDLWPMFSHRDEETKLKKTTFQSSVTGFLKRRRNIALISRGLNRPEVSRPATWWLSAEWNDVSDADLQGKKVEPIVLRPAGEVKVSYKCTEKGCDFRTAHKPALSVHKKHKHAKNPKPTSESEPTPEPEPVANDPIVAVQALVEENKRLRTIIAKMEAIIHGNDA